MSTATRKLQIDVEVNLQQSKQALQQVVAQTAQAAQQITQINKTQATSQAASAAKQEAAERRRLAEIRRTAAAENALWRQRDRALKEERQYWAQGARADRARANEAERAEKRRLAELKRASAAENALWRQRDRALKEEQRQKDQAARADRARANEAERAEKRRLAEIRRTAAAEKALYDQRTREIKRAEKAEQQESRRAMFQAGGGLAAGYGVARVGREALDFAKEGAQALALDKSFKALGYTLKDLDGVLAATGYNLDKVTVQRMVNLGHSFGFSVKQVTQFADIARAASIKTGQDMKWMFDSIVTGTARQSRLILDNLGILLDLSEAYKSHAATLGKTADALTDYEKKQAVVNEVMRQGKKFIEQVPLDKLGESIGRTETAFKDLWSTVKGAFAQWFVWTTSAYTGTAGVSENLTRLEHKTRKYGEAVLWLSSLQTDQDKALAGFGGEQLEALMQQKAFEEQFLRDSQMGVHALPTNPEQIRTMMDSLDIHKNIRDQVEKVLDGTIATEAERRKVAKLLYEEGQRINKIAKESLDKEAQLASYRKEQLTALREQERLQQAVRDAHAEYVGQQDQEARNIISANAALREHLKARILLARLPLFAAGAAGLPGGALRPAVKLPGADPSLFVGPPNKPDNRGGGAAPQKSKPRSVSTDNAVGQVAVQWGQNLWITPEEQALLDSISDSPVTESGNTGQDQSPTKKDKGKKVKEPKHIDPVGYLMGLVARREQQRVEDVDFFWQVKHGRKANPEESLAFQSLIAGAAGSAVGLPGALFKQQMQGLSPNVFAAGTDEELAKAEEYFKPFQDALAEAERERRAKYTADRKQMFYEDVQRGLGGVQSRMYTGDYESLGLTKQEAIDKRNSLRGELTEEDRASFDSQRKAKWQETNDVFGGLSEAIFNDPEQEKMKAIGEAIQENIAKPANIAADALKDITQGFANAGAAAIWEGKNFKKATNEMLRGIGQQATAKALFEGASALAALALGDVPTAILHGKAAAAYGVVAGVAALGAAATGGIRPPKEDKNEKTRGVPKARESSDGRGQTVIANTYYISYSGLSSDNDVRRMLFSVMNNGVGNNWLDSRLVEQR